jgi:hypothetical protein
MLLHRGGIRAGAGVAPRATAAMRSGDDLLDPGTWIAEHAAVGPVPLDDEPRTTARDLAYSSTPRASRARRSPRTSDARAARS